MKINFIMYVPFQSPCTVSKPAVIPKKRKFSNISLDSTDSLDNILSFPRGDSYIAPVRRIQSSESEISLEQTNEGQYFFT